MRLLAQERQRRRKRLGREVASKGRSILPACDGRRRLSESARARVRQLKLPQCVYRHACQRNHTAPGWKPGRCPTQRRLLAQQHQQHQQPPAKAAAQASESSTRFAKDRLRFARVAGSSAACQDGAGGAARPGHSAMRNLCTVRHTPWSVICASYRCVICREQVSMLECQRADCCTPANRIGRGHFKGEILGVVAYLGRARGRKRVAFDRRDRGAPRSRPCRPAPVRRSMFTAPH